MGACCSAPGEELPGLTEDDIQQLRFRGCLPCVATPSSDFVGKNQLSTVYVALYENGAELTFLFLDEDRPNACEDCLYDTIRRPLFGRFSDIESIFIIQDKVEFPGTHCGDQKWAEKVPHHNIATVDLSKFEKKDDTDPIIWINTWNHLLGEKNNNSEKKMTFQRAQPVGGVETLDDKDFVLRKGTRAEVDDRFKGLMTSVSKVMTPERETKLGKRLF
jgi:hypothetical protein